MALLALAAVAATWAGIACERRLTSARTLARRTLEVMLYALVPFVAYVNLAHLRISVGSGVGLALGWVLLGIVALLAWAAGRFLLHLSRAQLGAVVCCAVVTNTGYLGNPTVSALLGARALHESVAWDQLVGGPALFVLGFGIGASFAAGERVGIGARARRFLLRNPPLWAAIAGLCVPAGLAPNPLPAISRVVVDAMLVTGFFAAGVILSAERRHERAPLLQAPGRPVALILALRLIVAPLILLGLSALIVPVPSAYLIQSFMPTGLNSLVVGQAYGLDQRLIATTVLCGTAIVLVVAVGLGLGLGRV